MQVNPSENVLPTTSTTAAAVASVRVLSGNLSALPLGTLLQATVTQVSQGQAVIVANGQTLTVRPAGTLQPGNVLLIRAPNVAATTASTLEMIEDAGSEVNPSAGGATVTPQLARVDVLSSLPDGRFLVKIDGQEEVATSAEGLTAGGRYVLQVEETSAGISLSSPADTPDLQATLTAAILRTANPPDLGATLKPLLAELANLQAPQSGATTETPVSIREAATEIGDVLSSFLPDESRPLNATELQNLVQNGGMLFEAKLARLAGDMEPSTASDNEPPANNATGTSPSPNSLGPDLKEALLRLLQAAQEIGNGMQFPATRSALDGIETQQAANVFAQTQGTPSILQIPFPDGEVWRTLHLSIDPEGNKQQGSGKGSGFRMLMHVPLTDLGETWIDAGVTGNNLRAVVYLSRPAILEQVRAELPALRTELQTDGFGEVLLDVRPASALPASQRKQATAMLIGRPGSGSVLDVRA